MADSLFEELKPHLVFIVPAQLIQDREPTPAHRLLLAVLVQALEDVAELDRRARGGEGLRGDTRDGRACAWTVIDGARALRWLLDESNRWRRPLTFDELADLLGLDAGAVRARVRDSVDLDAIVRFLERRVPRQAPRPSVSLPPWQREPPAPRDAEWIVATARERPRLLARPLP